MYLKSAKIGLLYYKSFLEICDMFGEYKPSRALRSKDSGQLVQSRVQTKHGEAAFSCYTANKWNKLPVEMKTVTKCRYF